MNTATSLLSPSLSVAALLFAVAGTVFAQTPAPQPTLTQAVAELQRNPADATLRERIIKLAAEMNPAPAVPEEARRHHVKTLLADAKNRINR